jgi:hypothetical protein
MYALAPLALTLALAANPAAAPHFFTLRGEGDVPASVLEVAAVLVDVQRESEWFGGVEDAHPLRKVSDTEYVMYAHLAAPGPISDRDFVVDVSMTIEPTRPGLTLQFYSVDDTLAPPTRYVRAQIAESSFTLRANGDGTTHVIAELRCDPKGYVPLPMVKAFQSNWGSDTLRNLRHQVAQRPSPIPALLRERLSAATGSSELVVR